MSNEPLSAEQQEIVDLLRNEFAELVSEEQERLDTGDFNSQESLLYETRIHLEHIANALELSGLKGLSFCCGVLVENFKSLLEQSIPAPHDLSLPMSTWGSHIVGYLQYIAESDKSATHVKQLLAFLSQPELPRPLTPEEIDSARELFHLSDLSQIVDDEPAIPTEVSDEMCSLNIPSDVRPELLQGMLIELPIQMKQFETSIDQFLATNDFADLNQAQRVAHTIKGAANVVSIQGIANLTHYTEDLLETAAKNLNNVPAGFENLLIRTSDCLASTAEHLVGQGNPPDDINDVMQLILDWLGRLKTGQENTDTPITTAPEVALPTTSDKATSTTEPSAPETQQAAPPTETTPTQTTPVEANAEPTKATPKEHERHISLQEKTAHELLRLSGEIQISNNQVTSQINAVDASLQLTHRYHKQIKTMAAELEAMVQTQSALRAASMKYSDNEIDPLEMERFNELHTFSHRLSELTTDSYETINNIEQQIEELSGLTHSQRQLNNDNQSILLEINLIEVSTLSSRFSRCARQTSRLTKKAATLEIIGEQLQLDSRVLNRIVDPIMHLIRNAIDHGLEDSAEQRRSNNKPEEGKITLSFINQGDTVEIRCEDDGTGLDYAKIHRTALERGLVNQDTDVNEALLNQIILMSGFSTRGTATQTSGRGIGLDSVIEEIRALKGNMNITSEPNKGCTITITVPTSILTSHALLVECRDRHMARTYGIATRGLKQVVYVDQEELIRKHNHTYFSFRDEEILVQTLSELLGTISLEEEAISALLITQRSDGKYLAIGVEHISDSQDLVIKPLNKHAYQAPGVIGATILGDGTVSPVIDIHDLPGLSLSEAEMDMALEDRARKILAERAAFTTPPAALIVDDSLSARRSLAQFVSDMGMEVYTAKDGFDAIHVMEDKKPSLMLVDLEMPRMNGLELTAHIRSREGYEDIPVIMITSRSTSRHKEMARTAGVTRYLTKPWSDDELISCIQKEIA